jgi:hypothetical protein
MCSTAGEAEERTMDEGDKLDRIGDQQDQAAARRVLAEVFVRNADAGRDEDNTELVQEMIKRFKEVRDG